MEKTSWDFINWNRKWLREFWLKNKYNIVFNITTQIGGLVSGYNFWLRYMRSLLQFPIKTQRFVLRIFQIKKKKKKWKYIWNYKGTHLQKIIFLCSFGNSLCTFSFYILADFWRHAIENRFVGIIFFFNNFSNNNYIIIGDNLIIVKNGK